MPLDDAHLAEAWLPGEQENVTYRPDGVALSDRNIKAVVDRNPVAPVPDTPGHLRPDMIVYVLNDSTLGISASELDCGTDVLLAAKRVGGTLAAMHIARAIEQDAGMLALEVH